MRIIKKIDNDKPLENLIHSLRDLPCSGICVQAKHDAEGRFTIKGIEAESFVSNISMSLLALNIHLYNEKRLSEVDYFKICRILAKIKDVSSVILSSSTLSRQALNEFRARIIDSRKLFPFAPNIFIASSGDLFKPKTIPGDMIYSESSQSKNDYEFDRLTEHTKNGVSVLLDWPNNDNQRISRIIEMANNSDDLIILSKKPQTTRGIINRIG